MSLCPALAACCNSVITAAGIMEPPHPGLSCALYSGRKRPHVARARSKPSSCARACEISSEYRIYNYYYSRIYKSHYIYQVTGPLTGVTDYGKGNSALSDSSVPSSVDERGVHVAASDCSMAINVTT